MTRTELAQQIIDTCLKMNASGLNQGTSGNVSARWQDGMLITPSGVPYEKLAEGVEATSALLLLSDRYGVELPICRAVDSVITGGQKADRVLSDLFLRSLKKEF